MVIADDPAAPCGPRVTCSTRFDIPKPGTIRKAALPTIPWRELHAWKLIFELDSTSHAENGTVNSPCPCKATWSGIDDNHGGSFTGRISTRKLVEAVRPLASDTITKTPPVPETLGGANSDNQRFVPVPPKTMLPRYGGLGTENFPERRS